MIEKAIRWIRDKYGAIRNAPSSSDPVIPPTVDDASEARQKFADAFDSFSDFFRSIANNLQENTYLQQFITMGESFRKSGYWAGHWGVKDPSLENTAALHILITKSLIDEKCRSNQQRLKSQVEILRTIKNNAERDYETKNSYYEKLKRAYQYSHRQFSLLLGVIYGFFSVVLVLADIPLALELTKRGLNLKSDPTSKISDLFAYGTPEGFTYHFLKVLTVNWEVVVFATGIAFCTIYIKVFYDDFIGSPLENLIKKTSESPRADYEEIFLAESQHAATGPPAEDAQSAEKKTKVTDRFNRLWWVRFFVKLTVLAVLFLTILVLGYFRYSVVLLQDQNRDPAEGVGVAATSPRVVFLTYTMLTLIFPIISGICASLSLNSFHNWSERRKAGKESSEARKAALEATREFMVQEEEEARNQGFLEWLQNPETITQLEHYLVDCYRTGYQFGYLYPKWVWGGDLYTRAEALRNRNLTDPDIPIPAVKPATPVTLPQNMLH
jgi:hypothetical protein